VRYNVSTTKDNPKIENWKSNNGGRMPTIKAYHNYQLRAAVRKTSMHIEKITPTADREVSQIFFDEYDDLTIDKSQLPAMVKFDCVEETNV
jgi:hypothetical protein